MPSVDGNWHCLHYSAYRTKCQSHWTLVNKMSNFIAMFYKSSFCFFQNYSYFYLKFFDVRTANIRILRIRFQPFIKLIRSKNKLISTYLLCFNLTVPMHFKRLRNLVEFRQIRFNLRLKGTNMHIAYVYLVRYNTHS